MRNYNTACSSLRPGQLDKLMNNLHDGGRGMMSPVKCSCGLDKNVCVDCLIDGFEEVYKSLKATLHELEQWNLTEGEETACSILKDGFRVLKKYHMNPLV